MFEVGSYVIYKRDVCLVNSTIEKKGVSYYVLTPIDDMSLTIEVPFDNKFSHVRKVVSKDEALELIKKIPDVPIIETNTKMIENEYKILFGTMDMIDLIKIIKTTYLRNASRIALKKKAGEKDMIYFKKAERMLYNELSVSLGLSFNDTKEYVIKSIEGNKK